MHLFGGINWLAVGTSAAACLLIRAVWYSQSLAGRAWAKANGYSAEKLALIRRDAWRMYIGALLAYGVMAIVLSILVDTTGAKTAVEGLHLGFLCWLGFAATIGLLGNLFSGRSPAVFYIDAGCQLLCMALITVILTVWQ